MTESHTFPEDENEAHKLVKFARLINAKEKELQESQIETLLNVFVDGCCGKSDRLVMIQLVKGLLERAFLYAQINNIKTQTTIEREAQRLAGYETTQEKKSGDDQEAGN